MMGFVLVQGVICWVMVPWLLKDTRESRIKLADGLFYNYLLNAFFLVWFTGAYIWTILADIDT